MELTEEELARKILVSRDSRLANARYAPPVLIVGGNLAALEIGLVFSSPFLSS